MTETRDCHLSDDGLFRFSLSCYWEFGRPLAWLMLNPATATHVEDDLTFRRVRHFTKLWGFGGFTIVNVIPFRTACPWQMWKWFDSVRDDDLALIRNLDTIRTIASIARLRVVAFGCGADRADHPRRRQWLTAAVTAFTTETHHACDQRPHCLATTQGGWPTHPMARGKTRIPDDARPHPWSHPMLEVKP